MADAFSDLPEVEAGCRMPSAHAIALSDRAAHEAARWGSQALLKALFRYFAKHHPPAAGEGL
jgi:hypothetical protein